MSPKQLATKLLGFRSSSSLLVPGQLCADLGEEAMREALSRGWIEPNHDTGFLQLSAMAGRLQEMVQLSEKACEKCGKGDCECGPKQEESQQSGVRRGYAMHHAHRHESTYGLGSNASTSGAPGSGQPARAAVPPPRPPMAPNTQQDYMVGEDVMIADEGKSYQAKIASKNPDGTYRLSFGPNRPVTQDRAYRREEMQKIRPEGEMGNKVTIER